MVFFLPVAAMLIITGCSSSEDTRTPQQSNGNAGQMSNGMTVGVRQQGYETIDNAGPGSGQSVQSVQSRQSGQSGPSGSNRPTGSKMGITANNWPSAISDSDTGIQVLSVTTSVRQGDNGSLVIRGVPDTVYRVTAVYNNSQGIMTAASDKLSDRDGTVAWVWSVKPDTLPGTYRLVVSSGGKMIGTSYTVTK